MEYPDELRKLLDTYKEAFLNRTLSDELADNTGCPRHLHRLFMELFSKLKDADASWDNLDREYNALLEEMGKVNTPETEVTVYLDPEKIDIEALKQGKQTITIPVFPANIEYWRELVGKNLHYSIYRLGDKVRVKGMKAEGTVTNIILNRGTGHFTVNYLLSDVVGLFLEDQLEKVS